MCVQIVKLHGKINKFDIIINIFIYKYLKYIYI